MILPCDSNFQMKVTGKEEDVKEFLNRLNGDSVTGKHYVMKKGDFQVEQTETVQGVSAVVLHGDYRKCEWGAIDGLRKDSSTFESYQGQDAFLVSLEDDAKSLNLVVEFFSQSRWLYNERQENHFVIDNGKVAVDETACCMQIHQQDYLDNPERYAYKFNELNIKYSSSLRKSKEKIGYLLFGGYEDKFADYSKRYREAMPLEDVISNCRRMKEEREKSAASLPKENERVSMEH